MGAESIVGSNVKRLGTSRSKFMSHTSTFDPTIDSAPIWSPDGSQVIFRSTRNGSYDLFEKPTTGTADEHPLLVTPQAKSPLDCSPDGRFLLYSVQDPKTGSDLWALPLTGERKPFAVLQAALMR